MENNITQLRKRTGLNQSELARRLNVSRSFLSRVEKGHKKCSVEMALKISVILGCGLDDIFLFKQSTNRSNKVGETVAKSHH